MPQALSNTSLLVQQTTNMLHKLAELIAAIVLAVTGFFGIEPIEPLGAAPIPTAQEQVLLTKIAIAQASYLDIYGEYFQVNKGKRNPDDTKDDFAKYISKGQLTDDMEIFPYCSGCNKPEGHGYTVIIGNKHFGYGPLAERRTFIFIIPKEVEPFATST